MWFSTKFAYEPYSAPSTDYEYSNYEPILIDYSMILFTRANLVKNETTTELDSQSDLLRWTHFQEQWFPDT